MVDVLRVLSIDPGTVNMGYALQKFRVRRGRLQRRIVTTGMVRNTVRKVHKGVGVDMRKYSREIRQLLKFKPHIVVIERFMSRGLRNATGEIVSMMLGIASHLALEQGCQLELVPAVTWKNAVNKFLVPPLAHKKGGKGDTAYTHCGATPHELDATLTASYFAAQFFGLKPFEDLGSRRATVRLLVEVETKTSVTISARRLDNVRRRRKAWR